MNQFRAYGVTCVLWMVTVAAHATTIVLPSDEQLIAKTPVIVDGTVLSTATVERDGRIWTDTVVAVAQALKGTVDGTVTVHEIGGVLDGRVTKVYGTPEFAAGERVLLFLDQSPRGGYRTVDLYVGKFSEESMRDGRRLWTRRDDSPEVNLLDANLQPLRARNVRRDAIGFENFVRDRVAGREGLENYGVADAGGINGRFESEFTLIAEPTVYRWFGFGSGQTAQWYSSGTQPGYTNGGVNELQTAMQSWTGYSEATISYAYAGSRTGPLGGLDGPNGVNEVLFNDPLDEIAGTWNGNGVVGTGGFNGVTSRQTWTATFAADAGHPAGAQMAWNIIEGNLTIQNGVTSANGISSRVLAEILAHEFGHTLGFGHSPDPGALMFASVTGAGPQLRSDDQIGARWLYPKAGGGTAEPPPPPPSPPPTAPAAPSILTAAASGSSANLSWNDNASNETGFAIYRASAVGAFSKIKEVSANATSTGVTGLQPGTWRFYVVAFNSAGNSPQSNTATVTINAAVTPFRALVSVATYGGGVAGTSWRTELNLFNAGAQSASVSVIFIPNAGGNMVTRSLSLGPRQLVTYANALVNLFGIGSGAGALGIEATSGNASADLRVSSRTFTTGALGTYGQAVPDVQSEELAKTLYITGIASNAAFRTNVGLVNRGGTAMDAILALYSRTGAVLGTRNVSIPANSFQQAPLASFFAEVEGASHDVLTMRIAAAAGDAISGYASVVDNLTQDPVYQQARTAESGGVLTIPVVGRAPGANGTFWRSDVTLFNPSSGAISLTLRYGGATKSISLGGNDTTVLADVLSQFGLASGSGALQVTWSSSTGPVATSRTYTSVATGGTFGQSIDPVAELTRRAFVPGLRNDQDYRSNVGFVNGGAATETFTAILLSPSGAELARKTLTLAAGQQSQSSVSALFPGASLPNGFTLQIEGDSDARLFVYGSMVDNRSGDPVFFAGR